MGDALPHQIPGNDSTAGGLPVTTLTTQSEYLLEQQPSESLPPYQAQFQHYGSVQHAFSPQFDMAQPQGPARPGPYNMTAIANALPQAANYRGGQYPAQQRYNPAVSSPQVVGQVQPTPQYPAGQASMGSAGAQHFYLHQSQQHMTQYYGPHLSSQQQGNISGRASMGYYPNQLVMSHPQAHPAAAYYYPQGAQFLAQTHSIQGHIMPGQYITQVASQTDPRGPQTSSGTITGPVPLSPTIEQKQGSTEKQQGIVRGPPRKPKQSGHAIWIGNLPPQTDLISLVHHVCNEAGGLESLFLISKSNCAFANFQDEMTCVEAQVKLHDSKFQSVRLVSRLRKSTVEGAAGVTAPTGPSASASTPQQDVTHERSDGMTSIEDSIDKAALGDVPSVKKHARSGAEGTATAQRDKFFILKSLTVEDLELSVRTGIWATQSHNEETLNNAFKMAENVYLIFSANKSGEYFGYARMISPINEDPAAAIEFAPNVQSANDLDLPKSISTEATEFVPKGRIIDDSGRGTIFWEVDREEQGSEANAVEFEEPSLSAFDDSSSAKSGLEDGGTKSWGKPFQLEWLSTTRLPFYRTRGLRNPWNSNREVKIARDGTELEPSIGRRLIGLFNRVHTPSPGAAAGGVRQGVPMMVGYPPMRPPYPQ